MIVGFYQFSPTYGRPEENVARMDRAVRESRADLLVCPELATSGYLYLDRAALLAVAEPVPAGPSVARLSKTARETGTAVVFGLPERDGDRIYNSAVLLAADGGAVTYRKAHLFDTETTVFDRSGESPRHARVAGADVGLMICFDWRFPEVARLLAIEGADVIAHPANLVHPYCQDAMITRSIENRVFSVTASRTGSETVGGVTLSFAGRSQIVSPGGERLAQADATEECVRTATIDPALARDKRVTARNDLLGDRRTDLFGPLLADPAERPR